MKPDKGTLEQTLELPSRREGTTLTGVTQLLEQHPSEQKVADSIPGRSTRRGCRFGPQSGHIQETTNGRLSHTAMLLSFSFSLPSLLSKNKINTIFEGKKITPEEMIHCPHLTSNQ